jgi:hypothetical protein
MAEKSGLNFVCEICNEEFVAKYSLKQHFKDIHGKSIFGLPREFNYEKLVAVDDGLVKCFDCNKIFSCMKGARVHYRNMHVTDRNTRTSLNVNEKINRDQSKPLDSGNVKCSECNKINFVCNVCGKGFALEFYMKRHVKDIHGLPIGNLEWKKLLQIKDGHIINKFRCELCRRCFTAKYSVIQHIRNVHSLARAGVVKPIENSQNPIPDKKCKCTTCVTNFENMLHFRQNCKHPKWTIKDIGPCKKLFQKFDFPSLKTLKSNGSTLCTMQGANKLHFKLNSFECLYCEKSFTQKGNLKIHVNRIHNKMKENRCKFCGKAFSEKIH